MFPIPHAMGHQPGWCQFIGMVANEGKFEIVGETDMHGSMPAVGVSRFGETGHRFQNEVIGALQFILMIDFSPVVANDLGRITIQFEGSDNVVPDKHETLCGSHRHLLTPPSTFTALDDDYKPYSFENYIFFGVVDKTEFSFAITSETGSTDGIKADLYIARLGFGKEFKDGGVGV